MSDQKTKNPNIGFLVFWCRGRELNPRRQPLPKLNWTISSPP